MTKWATSTDRACSGGLAHGTKVNAVVQGIQAALDELVLGK